MIIGNVILYKTVNGLAPSIKALRSTSISILPTTDDRALIAYGIATTVCERIKAVFVRTIPVAVKKNNNPIPIPIIGIVNGAKNKVFKISFPLKVYLSIAKVTANASAQDIIAVIKAINKLIPVALINFVLLNASMYHLMLRPSGGNAT